MIRNSLKYSFFLILAGFFFISTESDNEVVDYSKTVKDLSLEEALIQMGEKKPLHYIEKLNSDSANIGYQLITTGQLKNQKHKKLSKFFVCTDCHNLTTEVYDLADESPKARLKYGMDKGIPYLPASTFYGMYNKTNWYNGDYALKYGDLVLPTRDSLVNAIQLCAVQCSQGRPMESWEIRSILHYYKSIGIKITDLKLSNDELDRLTKYVLKKDKTGIKLLKQKYNSINSATFGKTEKPEISNYSGNSKQGEYIFNNGCLHCHDMGKGITNFEFDTTRLTLDFFEAQFEKHNPYTVPYIVRKGTYAINGRRQYMPQYTLEKMSEHQLIDVLAYISTKGKK